MKRVGILVTALVLSISVFAQEYPDSPYEKPHVSNRKPIKLQTIRYADVMWSKKIEIGRAHV